MTLGEIGDVGGQKTLRSYWRNFYETTDALIWVVDANDRDRIEDCRHELSLLLLEEVLQPLHWLRLHGLTNTQRLMGASLLVFLNKIDVQGCMTDDDIQRVRSLSIARYQHF